MTLSVRERLLAAFFQKMDALRVSLPALKVERNRADPVTAFPTLVVIDGNQTAQTLETHMTRYALSVDVEGFVQVSTGLGSEVNVLLALVQQAALDDLTLGGLCFDIEEGEATIEIDRNEGRLPMGAFLLPFTIHYYTAEGDPFTPAP